MAHEDWVLDTVFSTNGTHVISVGRDMTAKLTEVPTQRFVDNITSITPGALRGGLASRRPSSLPRRGPGRRGGWAAADLSGVPTGRAEDRGQRHPAPQIPGNGRTHLQRQLQYPDGKSIAAAASLDQRGSVSLYGAEFDPTLPEVLLKAYQKTSGEYTPAEREAIEQFTTAGVKLLHKFPVPAGASVYATAFSPDGRHVAAGTSSGLVLLFNTVDGAADLVFAVTPPADAADNSSWNAASPVASLADAWTFRVRPRNQSRIRPWWRRWLSSPLP